MRAARIVLLGQSFRPTFTHVAPATAIAVGVAFGLRDGKVVAGPVGGRQFELSAPSMDTVILYALHATTVQVCVAPFDSEAAR